MGVHELKRTEGKKIVGSPEEGENSNKVVEPAGAIQKEVRKVRAQPRRWGRGGKIQKIFKLVGG